MKYLFIEPPQLGDPPRPPSLGPLSLFEIAEYARAYVGAASGRAFHAAKAHLSRALSILVLSLCPLLAPLLGWIACGSDVATWSNTTTIGIGALTALGVGMLVYSGVHAVRGLIALHLAMKWAGLVERVPEGTAARSPEISSLIESLLSSGMIKEVGDDTASVHPDEVRYAFTFPPRPFFFEHPGQGKALTRDEVTAFLRGRARDVTAFQRMRARRMLVLTLRMLLIGASSLVMIPLTNALPGPSDPTIVRAIHLTVAVFCGFALIMVGIGIFQFIRIRYYQPNPPRGLMEMTDSFTVSEDKIPGEIEKLLQCGLLAIVRTDHPPRSS